MKILIPLAFILTLFATNVNALQKDGVFFVITGHYENTDIVKSAAILKFATMSECQAATYEFFDDLEKTDGKIIEANKTTFVVDRYDCIYDADKI